MQEIRDRRDKHWFWIDDAVIDEHAAAIGPWALALYVVLVRHANKQHHCYPSMRHLEKILGATRQTIRKHLQVLVTHGLIAYTTRTTEDGKDTSSLYTILSPNAATSDAARCAAPGAKPEAHDTTNGRPVSGEGGNFHPSREDLPGEGGNFHPSPLNFYPKGIGFKELGIEGSFGPLTPCDGEQKSFDPESGEQSAETIGEHNECSGDDSPMAGMATPLPKHSRAYGTAPRQLAEKARQEAAQMQQAAIDACLWCESKGTLLFFDAGGLGFVARCPHDLPKILAYVALHAYTWPAAPPGPVAPGPAPPGGAEGGPAP